ncbi:histidine kinase [Sphaerotilus sp.]|uniref:hybrid sensor histidine kinase/response regulator n=1 Tax=Sphaerotilus sp. TaxID=2093942 RepID=UPI002ACE9986|nr:histidine kinase [Sphaerotilus sp.]MDZ7856144.1 histidine kinase [Sphaerotilus sp.]
MYRPPPPRRLRILHLEDSDMDHQLVLVHLRRGGIEATMHRVDTEGAFLAALGQSWDAVISDYNLPGFSGLIALELLRDRDTLLPFILVSGEIGEDTAVEAMRNGASDYLLKSNLNRLVPALLHAVEVCEGQRARQRTDAELARSRKRLSELAQHLQTSIEMERAAIAREVHDDVGGSLTAVKFDLAWIARHAPNGPMAERAQQALESVNHAIEASQRIMHNLRPAILEQGLVAALQWMTQRFERRTGMRTTFRTSHDHLSLSPGVPLVAYRTAQEALTNISKHAKATRVQVDLTVAAGVLSLEISDNGRGLANGDLGKDHSFGIRGLHERADTVGGWIDLSSSPTGTTLILSVPLDLGGEMSRAGDAEPDPPLTSSPHDPSTWGAL